MNPLAAELNEMIQKANPHVYEMLSTLGREMYFPKGILTQSAEAKAKAKKHNATLGVATEGGHHMALPSLMGQLKGFTSDEALPYAPVAGLADLRAAWRDKDLKDNPSLAGKPVSLPIVTNGLTHGLSIIADLFCEAGDTLLLPDQIWGNYRLTYVLRRGAAVVTYPFFGEKPAGGCRGVACYAPTGAHSGNDPEMSGFNLPAFKSALQQACKGKSKVLVLLNFPNNPTGYSITRPEGEGIAAALTEAAEGGVNVVAVVDDAYYGLFYEPEVMTESLFTLLAGRHERLLAVKCDAATKEVFVWGLRVGFLSFSVGGVPADSPLFAALEKKVSGEIRSVMSNCSMLSQQAVLRSVKSAGFFAERAAKKEILQARAREVRRVLADPRYESVWIPYPFNSGYFMCVKLKKVSAETLRKALLEKYAVGTIATAEHDLRIAFSCVEKGNIKELFDIIYKAASELG